MASRRTLIVGAGITGATLARLLRDAKRSGRYAGEVVVWEKNNIVGGRMMARSFRKNRHVHVDMGAQYLTRFNSANDDLRAMLTDEGALIAFDDARIRQDPTRTPMSDPQHAVGPQRLGFRGVVQHLLADIPLHTSREITHFEILNQSQVRTVAADGTEEIVNDLVLTCPVPQALEVLKKSNLELPAAQLTALRSVAYSQRFAVAYLFDSSIARSVKDLCWTSKYVTPAEDEIVRYLCWDNLKKTASSTTEPDSFALLVHTGVPFGVEHMDRKEHDAMILETITSSVRKLLPFLPEPTDTLLHRWRMSQVIVPYRDVTVETTTPAIVLSRAPRIVLAGDAFLGSIFDNCVLSAKYTADVLVESASSPTSLL